MSTIDYISNGKDIQSNTITCYRKTIWFVGGDIKAIKQLGNEMIQEKSFFTHYNNNERVILKKYKTYNYKISLYSRYSFEFNME